MPAPGSSRLRSRLQSIGVSVSETKPETRIATLIVTANSWKRRPSSPPMKRTGMKTATSEIVIERIVKPISFEPRREATAALSPFSIRRTMFSSWTIASSTTNPTERVSPMRERLSRLNPRTAITANVPKSDVGSAIDGMNVERRFLRNRKITKTTRTTVRTSVSWTSRTLSRIPCERSNMMSIRIAAGIWIRKAGRSALTASTTWIVFESGWR